MDALPANRTWQPPCRHDTYQHEAIMSRSRQLLMMGTWFPETCWATSRREIKNTKVPSSCFFLSTLNYDARSTTHQIYSNSFQNLWLSLKYEYLFLLTTFSAFSDLVNPKYWGCLYFRFLCLLTLFPVCFFHFPSSFFSDKKESCSFHLFIFSVFSILDWISSKVWMK